MIRNLFLSAAAAATALALAGCSSSTPISSSVTPPATTPSTPLGQPVTPIQHVIVIFGENISYDHYFATYPSIAYSAADSADAGEIYQTNFPSNATAPANNNLVAPLNPGTSTPVATPTLLTDNPNGPTGSGATYNAANAVNPFLLWNNQAATADQNHSPKPEQLAYDNGAMDKFPGSTGSAASVPASVASDVSADLGKGQVMGYFDGITTTALWNYAQSFAMNDNAYTSQFGPSTPGALNLISGQTNGLAQTLNLIPGTTGVQPGNCTPSATNTCTNSASTAVPDGNGGFTLVGDSDPLGDICSTGTIQVSMAGKNIGDLLNAQNVTWGWFQGGFNLTAQPNANGSYGCNRNTPRATTKPIPTTSSTTSPSSTTPAPPTSSTCAPAPRSPSAARLKRMERRPTRPITSTTPATSSPPCSSTTCPPSPSSRRPDTKMDIPATPIPSTSSASSCR